MVRLFRILSIVMLVVHLTMGCCAEDSRACGSNRIFAAANDATALGEPCQDCGCHPSHHGSRECQDREFFLAAQRRPIGGSFTRSCQAPLAGLANDHTMRLAASCQRRFRATGHLLPPVRIHLAHQVLLI